MSAFIGTAFAQETPDAASQMRPKLATLMDDAELDVLAYMTFPKEHRAELHSTNPIERLNGEIKRRTQVVGVSVLAMPPAWLCVFHSPTRLPLPG